MSRNVKDLALSAFAISPIMKWAAFPGIIGMFMLLGGLYFGNTFLVVPGAILFAPVAWCYFVIIFVYGPMMIVEAVSSSRKKQKRSE